MIEGKVRAVRMGWSERVGKSHTVAPVPHMAYPFVKFSTTFQTNPTIPKAL
jgi:hypothetical protein